MPPVRRLTAILAADVAGYSRLMGADEEGTHERLKAHLGELVEPKISQHRGRTVKNTGDGLVADELPGPGRRIGRLPAAARRSRHVGGPQRVHVRDAERLTEAIGRARHLLIDRAP